MLSVPQPAGIFFLLGGLPVLFQRSTNQAGGRSLWLIIILLFLFAGLPSNCPATARGSSQRTAIETASFDLLANGRLIGNGWFASPAGFAVTAAHLLAENDSVEISSPATGRRKADVIAVDRAYDLALLRIPRDGDFFPYLPISSRKPTVGQAVFSYGSALFRHQLHFQGMVSKTRPHFEWNARNQCYSQVYLLSAMTPKGLSGAAWVNDRNEVVGIQSGMMTWKGALMGTAFIAPAEAIAFLLKHKRPRPAATLGLQVAETMEGVSTTNHSGSGLLVTRVLADSPAAQSGISKGDRILTLNGRKIRYRDDFLSTVRNTEEGQKLLLELKRGTENWKLKITPRPLSAAGRP
ncbi:hypothetical protein C2E25_13665 [Geothermobacter hydrogeniphilus]|uniref:PDZ domain-containing protein n=1 Tax=Geothermobacter hydrogeniphilus TaxID=1969733 RepID=A0A2K2H7F4_9BACT|nr:hypothetical protein C2E25_13665 [Geothermobacter hydrogeniphilus]